MATRARTWVYWLISSACLCAWIECQTVVAQELSQPDLPVILEISGKITRHNQNDRAVFDHAMLEQIGTAIVETSTPWTDGVQKFRGPLVRDVLKLVGCTGHSVRAVALNDYIIDIPIEDFETYPVILAFEANGRRLQVRDKGPIWIIYPLDQFEALQDRLTERKMVWQLRELEAK